MIGINLSTSRRSSQRLIYVTQKQRLAKTQTSPNGDEQGFIQTVSNKLTQKLRKVLKRLSMHSKMLRICDLGVEYQCELNNFNFQRCTSVEYLVDLTMLLLIDHLFAPGFLQILSKNCQPKLFSLTLRFSLLLVWFSPPPIKATRIFSNFPCLTSVLPYVLTLAPDLPDSTAL